MKRILTSLECLNISGRTDTFLVSKPLRLGNRPLVVVKSLIPLWRGQWTLPGGLPPFRCSWLSAQFSPCGCWRTGKWNHALNKVKHGRHVVSACLPDPILPTCTLLLQDSPPVCLCSHFPSAWSSLSDLSLSSPKLRTLLKGFFDTTGHSRPPHLWITWINKSILAQPSTSPSKAHHWRQAKASLSINVPFSQQQPRASLLKGIPSLQVCLYSSLSRLCHHLPLQQLLPSLFSSQREIFQVQTWPCLSPGYGSPRWHTGRAYPSPAPQPVRPQLSVYHPALLTGLQPHPSILYSSFTAESLCTGCSLCRECSSLRSSHHPGLSSSVSFSERPSLLFLYGVAPALPFSSPVRESS